MIELASPSVECSHGASDLLRKMPVDLANGPQLEWLLCPEQLAFGELASPWRAGADQAAAMWLCVGVS